MITSAVRMRATISGYIPDVEHRVSLEYCIICSSLSAHRQEPQLHIVCVCYDALPTTISISILYAKTSKQLFS